MTIRLQFQGFPEANLFFLCYNYWGDTGERGVVYLRLNGWLLPLVLLVAVAVFGVLWGGQYLYQQYYWADSLKNNLYKVQGVKEVNLLTEKGVVEVQLEVVDRLQPIYSQLYDQVAAHQMQLVIKDNSDATLEDVFRSSQYVLYQAQVKGDYQDMHQAVTSEAAQAGVEQVEIDLDAENIYLQLHYKQYYLYRVIPRQVIPVAPGGWKANG